jgi:hypothetical protein
MPAVNKHFDFGAKRAIIEPWRAIMKQLGMSKATLKRVLAIAKANFSHPAQSLC